MKKFDTRLPQNNIKNIEFLSISFFFLVDLAELFNPIFYTRLISILLLAITQGFKRKHWGLY